MNVFHYSCIHLTEGFENHMLQYTHFIVNQAVTSHVQLQYMFLLDCFDCYHTVELYLDNYHVQNAGNGPS